jgi:CheY-like chemotaxis protein
MQLMGELLRTDMGPVERDALDQVIKAGARMTPATPLAGASAKSSMNRPATANGAPMRDSSASEALGIGLRKPRLLLVEDTELNRLVTLAMLGTGRFDIDCVASGEAAVQSIQDVHYDVVLMDISMPDMDGIAATRAIRALSAPACDVPILAMTAHAMVGDRERCLAAGMDDYLPKPVSRGDLLEKVEHFASLGRGAAASLVISDEPALNAEALDQLRRDMQPDALRQLFDATLPEVQTRVSSARAANEARDLDALGRSAHSIRGIATTIGAHRLQAAATALESAARTGRGDEISRLLESLEALSERTMRAIAQERARL